MVNEQFRKGFPVIAACATPAELMLWQQNMQHSH
jgi:hypothetical protein